METASDGEKRRVKGVVEKIVQADGIIGLTFCDDHCFFIRLNSRLAAPRNAAAGVQSRDAETVEKIIGSIDLAVPSPNGAFFILNRCLCWFG